jgi:hypothetical protein
MKRILLVLTVTFVMVAMAIATAMPAFADGSYNKKVTICHVPPGNPANAHTITVGASAVDAHLAHGDYLGKCQKKPPYPTY